MKTNKKKEESAVLKFPTEKLLQTDRYTGRRDALQAILEKEKQYSFAEADALLDKFMKGKVN